VLLLVDGLRPDGLARAATPNIDRLVAGGCATLEARTISPSATLPCVTSLFYGSTPDVHGVWHNDWPGPPPPFPSLVDVLREAGMTASYYNWEPLRDLTRPRPPDTALRLCRCDLPDADLDEADTAGHGHGWMSGCYVRAIEHADAAIANVIAALDASGHGDRTLLVVTSDHGGHDNTHGCDLPDDMIVPWIMHGPGIPKGVVIRTPVSIIDTAPTVAAVLGLDRPREWTGKPVPQVVDPTGPRST
jgi:arylsulfatase A-like enzyme